MELSFESQLHTWLISRSGASYLYHRWKCWLLKKRFKPKGRYQSFCLWLTWVVARVSPEPPRATIASLSLIQASSSSAFCMNSKYSRDSSSWRPLQQGGERQWGWEDSRTQGSTARSTATRGSRRGTGPQSKPTWASCEQGRPWPQKFCFVASSALWESLLGEGSLVQTRGPRYQSWRKHQRSTISFYSEHRGSSCTGKVTGMES